MFGYIVMNKPEIKMKDFDMYRSFYCGLCRELREKYGISGQITLSYDMTFVIMLLSGLYEPKTYKGTTRCILHPVRKQPVRKNVMTEYCADMNILLTYYKCLDDWNDDRKYVKLGYARPARIVDEMEEKGIVGPFQGSKPRALLVTKEQWTAMKGGGEQMTMDDMELEPIPDEIN